MEINSVNIIGVGNVGRHFLTELSSEIEIKTAFTKNSEKAKELSNQFNFPIVNDLKLLSEHVDLNIVCVKDDVIKDVLVNLPKSIPIVHTSGSVGIEILRDFETSGILYPLQTFSANQSINLGECYFLIEASTEKFNKEISEFCHEFFSMKTMNANSEIRSCVHLAAVFANNFSNNLFASSQKILAEKNIDFKILEPLIKESVRKAFEIGPLAAQTGPAIRKDQETINKQIALLNDDKLKEIYERISENIERYSTKS